MIKTGIESRVKIQDIVSNQLPDYVLEESPKTVEFLKQYYISQEYQGGPIDIAENLDQYLNLDNLTPDVVVDSTTLSYDIDSTVGIITVNNTKGFPKEYGILKIDDEIITYTGVTTNTFIGCKRGFCGITSYHQELNKEELVFSTSSTSSHTANSYIQNLSSLFLKEFYNKTKYTFVPGLENTDLDKDINIGSFIKESKSLYQTKGTNESFRILFNALYGITPEVLNLEDKLIKPSFADFTRRQVAIAEVIEGNPLNLKGQTIFKSDLNEDINTSISEIEPFERYNTGSVGVTTYYRIGLFVGYDEVTEVSDFDVISNTKSLESVSTGSSVITVDSTVGFSTSGTIISGINTISYTDKTLNQFLGCQWETPSSIISPIDNIRSNVFYYGYEHGDINKKVVLRFTSVLSNIDTDSKVNVSEKDIISVKYIGDKVLNPDKNRSYKEIFANSWVYNTSSTYFIKEFSPIKFESKIDKSSLKKGDYVEITERETNNIVYPLPGDNKPYVKDINLVDNTVTLEGFTNFSPGSSTQYNLRRKINKANSLYVPLEYGNDNITSDVQNVYFDNNFGYVASNSLPSYRLDKDQNVFPFTEQINVNTKSIVFNNSGIGQTLGFLTSRVDDRYSVINFGAVSPFKLGDRIYYNPKGSPMIGLETGTYYVKPGDLDREIQLMGSNAGIDDNKYLTFNLPPTGDNSHEFILYSQKSNIISPQKLFKKFSLESPSLTGSGQTTTPGGVGMLINGVEISNYKTTDKIYYGPLKSVNVLNPGNNFDVINPPNLSVSASNGTTALVQPVIGGKISKVYVDSQDFDIDSVVSIGITGGNGSGCVLEPIIGTRSREVLFNAKPTTQGGGINTVSEQIVFLTDHEFYNGEEITYDSNLNSGVGVGLGTSKLINNAVYYPLISNNRTIKLFNTFSDYSAGINTINFNGTDSSGIHKFKVNARKTLTEVKVLNGGENYTNRKLFVKPSGISIEYNNITFENHGFSDGELIDYSSTGNIITGLTTTNQYKIVKIDDNIFKLADAGIGGTITSNFTRKNYVEFNSIGSGYHNFEYPPIKSYVKFTSVGIGTTSIEVTPVVKGNIKQVYLYESGSGYGSTITNVQENPIITVKTGKESILKPVIINGQISSVNIEFGGVEYYSTPDLSIIDNMGSGAELYAVVENQTIVDVKITNPGIGYSTSASILVTSSGINQSFNTKIRSLTVNKVKQFGSNILEDKNNKLKYSIAGYGITIFSSSDSGNPPAGNATTPSGIIGWAYDGNPIYGPYGYQNPYEDPSNLSQNYQLKKLEPSYTPNITNVTDRPTGFELGYFIEDYQYDGSKDLDLYNGRYEINKDFPNGIYAYHASIGSDNNPVFPYFIGDKYRSNLIPENIEERNQLSIDFNKLNVFRNTFPYKVSDIKANNDFLTETNSLFNQEIEIESVSSGSIDGIGILNSGLNYKVDDILNFDNSNTDGEGLIAKVFSVEGKPINTIETNIEENDSTIFTWSENKIKGFILPRNNLSNNDTVVISKLTTDIGKLKSSYKIGITSSTGTNISTIKGSPSAGFTTEIYVSRIPNDVSIGSSIGIGTETLKILNIFDKLNILRVKRDSFSFANSYEEGTEISFIPDSFTIDEEFPYFESKVNEGIYFNPIKSVGIGTTPGTEYPISFEFAGNTIQRNVPVQQLYIENHPFKTNQKIKLVIPNGSSNINISTDRSNVLFTLPTTLYAVNKSINTIGIKTGIGVSFNEVYFRSFVSNSLANNDEYFLESDYDQVKGNVDRIKSTISLTTSSGLTNSDVISLEIKPNISVGIGTSSSILVKRNPETGFIMINPISFNNTSVETNKLNLPDHKLKTGEKIFYEGNATGLSTGSYFVYKVDEDSIRLGDTLSDVNGSILNTVSITTNTGASQSLSLINPQISSIKNNNLVFDLSDSSMTGYNFNLYSDIKFNNKFVSTGSTTNLSISNVGTSLTVRYSTNLPNPLYYNIEKSGFISTSDKDVLNYSEIVFDNSDYNGDYVVSGVTTNTFDIFLEKVPENLNYNKTQCEKIEYSSQSKTINGGIKNINVISGGYGYKKVPVFSGVGTESFGKDASLVPTSSSIGNINKIRVINDTYEYSSDNTLQPEAFISPLIEIKNFSTIGITSVIDGGSGYLIDPIIIIVNSVTGEIINSGYLKPNLIEGSISSLDIEEYPVGLPENTIKLQTVNNTNGITIVKVDSHSGAAFTCTITTPNLGFNINPFNVGDKVYIEGIGKNSSNGTGFNSADYNYQLLTVSNYDDSGTLDKVTIDVSDLTSNTGIADTIPANYASIISESRYPRFFVEQKESEFDIGEKITINGKSSDISIIESTSNIIKISGYDDILVGNKLVGESSGVTAEVFKISNNNAKFKTGFSLLKDFGWNNTVGKLDDDSQVVPNNDYYQNLSYSIKSSINWNELKTPVNNLLHTSGLKNFADVGIVSTTNVGIGSSSSLTVIYDVIGEKRVDVIKSIDLVTDSDVVGDTSRFIDFENLRLSDYINCISNEVLIADNINSQFSNLDSNITESLDITQFGSSNLYENYIIVSKSVGIGNQELQLTELVVLSTGTDNILLQKSNIINKQTSLSSDKFASYDLYQNPITQENLLRFNPIDTFNKDYDLKILSSKYNSNILGIGTFVIGPISLISTIALATSGITTTLVTVPTNDIGSIHATTQIIDTITNEINFVETYVTHNSYDTFSSEYYVDNNQISSNRIGNITSTINNNNLLLQYTNNTANSVKIKTKVVGFGLTTTSNNDYRFLSDTQPSGAERSVIYQGQSRSGIGSTSIAVLEKSVFDSVKSIVEVTKGSSKAVHEVLTLNDGTNLYVQQSQLLSLNSGSTSEYDPAIGFGSFGASYSGSDFILSFYPDDTSSIFDVIVLNQCMYTQIDLINDPLPFNYGKSVDDVDILQYNGAGGNRINKTDFELQSNSIPIFGKSFNPNSNDVNLSTGLFTLEQHNFKVDEEISYNEGSSFIGVGATPMMYKNGAITDILPSKVYVKSVPNGNTFNISTTRSGAAVTFVSVGSGNLHEFSMTNSNSKSLIAIDNVAQYPISETNIVHTLKYNTSIGDTSAFLSLSGISSIGADDLLKVDDEYLEVVNVGLGTTPTGPITSGIGTYNLVKVNRGVVGSIATTHTNNTQVRLYGGSYNIVRKNIHFTKPPRGNQSGIQLDGTEYPKSDFHGRVHLRNDYSTNSIYDDISKQFDGVTSTFTLTVGGANTTGIGNSGGNGILFVNGIFQNPTTDSHPDNNFKIIENAGISSVVFSGITSINGTQIISQSDTNLNQLPRGGVPISIGNSNGLGYAELAGAKVMPVLGGSGDITDVIGVSTQGPALAITTALYDNVSGIVTITTVEPHQFVFGNQNTETVKLVGLHFTCPSNSGVTTNFFPSGKYGDKFSLVSVASTNTFSVQVGTTTIPHTYNGQGNVYAWYDDLTYGSGYNNIVSIDVKVVDAGFKHKFVSADNNAINKVSGGQFTPTAADYDPVSGIMTVTSVGHGLETTNQINFDNLSLKFKCSKDGYQTIHEYPRPSDPSYGLNLEVTKVNDDIFTVNVGSSVGSGAIITATPIGSNTHQFVSATTDSIEIVTGSGSGSNLRPQTGTSYKPETGKLEITTNTPHGLVNGDTIKFKNNSIVFACEQDDYKTNHSYPRGGLEHKFVSATSTAINNSLQPVNAVYSGDTGYLILTFASAHGISDGALISIADNSLTMTCDRDAHATEHTYPRSTDPISVGGGSTVVSNATANSGKDLTVYVGRSGLSDPIAGITTAITKIDNDQFYVHVGKSSNHGGGALKFNIGNPGYAYKNPQIFVSEPSYKNLSVKGVSRRGIGSTTETGIGLLVDAIIDGPTSNEFELDYSQIREYKISRSGYSFREGDIIEPVGLVTDRRLISLKEKATIEIERVYNDKFSMWQFGEFDYIDSIKSYQNGENTKFPLYYDGKLVSFESDKSFDGNLANVFLIIINGVIQEPEIAYEFTGGTSIAFALPPTEDDIIDIFFYKGTDGIDCAVKTGQKTIIEPGDEIQILRNPSNSATIDQDKRTVLSLDTSKKLETNIYSGKGIDEINPKPINLIRQKVDKIINQNFSSKKRVNLEPLIFPTCKIIKDFSTSSTEFYVDNAELFAYDGASKTFGGLIVSGNISEQASATATILNGEVDSVTMTNNGSNYTSTPTISFSAPPNILDDNGVGIGITATATLSMSNGTITFGALTNIGLGYTIAPKVIISSPDVSYEIMSDTSIPTATSTSGDIIGIGTTMSGSNLSIKFTITNNSSFDPISVGNPIYINNTGIGDGLTSTDGVDSNIVGVGTTFIDNIYVVKEFTYTGNAPNTMTGIVTCTIKSDTNIIGLSTSGDVNNPVGKYSCGKISGFTRNNSPISIGVTGRIVSGLSTYPTLQRRSGSDTFEETGAITTPI